MYGIYGNIYHQQLPSTKNPFMLSHQSTINIRILIMGYDDILKLMCDHFGRFDWNYNVGPLR